MRVGWAVLGLLTLALVVGGGVILADNAHRTVVGAPVSEWTPTPTVAPVPTGTGTAPVPPTGPVGVAGVGTRQELFCDGNAVTVSGVDNTVIITGRCTRVDVSGVDNSVTLDESWVIAVSGLNNTVTYRSGTPELSKSGIGNTVNGK